MANKIKTFYEYVTGNDQTKLLNEISEIMKTLPQDYQETYERFSSIAIGYTAGMGSDMTQMLYQVALEFQDAATKNLSIDEVTGKDFDQFLEDKLATVKTNRAYKKGFVENFGYSQETEEAYKEAMKAIDALPLDYQTVFYEIRKYFKKITAGNVYATRQTEMDLLELFASSAARNIGVREVIGDDVATFAQILVSDAVSYYTNLKEQLNRNVNEFLNH